MGKQRNKKVLTEALKTSPKSSQSLVYKTNGYSSTSRKINNLFWTSPRILSYNEDPYKFIDPAERTRINAFALDLFRSSPLVNSAICRKNEWACATGWKPIFTGTDKAWGKLALDYLNNEALASVNIAGPNYSWNRTLLTIANQMDIVGDALIVFVPYATGMRLAVYPSSVVAQRGGDNTVQSGQYEGNEIDNGVIFSSAGYPIAYNILQDTPDQDYTYNVREAQLIFEPNELCRRGISALASPLLSLMDGQDISTYLNRNLKKFSKMPIVVNTESGDGSDYENDNLGEEVAVIENAEGKKITYQDKIMEFGDYTFFKAGIGEKFEIPSSDNPSTNAVEWLRHVGEECVSAMGWPYGLLHPSQLKGTTNARAMEAQVQQTIAVRQATLMRIAKQFVAMTLSRAMQSGRLPQKSDSDWNAFTFSLPPEFVIDSYYADQTNLQMLRAGAKTLQDVVARDGGDWEQVNAQKIIENKARIDHAKQLVAYSGGALTFERALDMAGNNGNIAAAPLQEQLADVPPQGE